MSDNTGYLCVPRIRAIEDRALATMAPGALMARAARALAHQAERMLIALPPDAEAIAMVGPGNNGADALCALERLALRGFRVKAFALETRVAPDTDAARVRERWLAAGGSLQPLDELPVVLATRRQSCLLIDGLFGIGLARPLSGAAVRVAQLTHRTASPVLAVDVPSGVDADTGAVVGGARAGAVRATCTVTFIADKAGLHTGRGFDLAGDVILAPLELTADGVDGLCIDRAWVASRLRTRATDGHKGTFGSLAVLGGATGMPGAALLAGRAAQAAGAGKVAIISPDSPVFSSGSPQLMAWSMSRPAELESHLGRVNAAVMGCGLGTAAGSRTLFARALGTDVRAIIDADGLNMVADRDATPELMSLLSARSARTPTIVTPHPLEAARLLAQPVERIETDRIGSARELANRTGATVLLKGAGTVLAAPDGRWALIASGNVALATGGTGDMLAGIVGAFLGQGYSAWEAAALAAWLHGDAADRWRQSHTRGVGLTPDALLDSLIEAINQC